MEGSRAVTVETSESDVVRLKATGVPLEYWFSDEKILVVRLTTFTRVLGVLVAATIGLISIGALLSVSGHAGLADLLWGSNPWYPSLVFIATGVAVLYGLTYYGHRSLSRMEPSEVAKTRFATGIQWSGISSAELKSSKLIFHTEARTYGVNTGRLNREKIIGLFRAKLGDRFTIV
jgi:hypothetical protein